MTSVPSTPTEDETSANVAVVRRLLEEVWNDGDIDLADELVAADAVDHDKQPGEADGLASFKEHVALLRAAASQMHLAIDQIWGVGDRVVVRWRWQGVHDGPMFGMPPTGQAFDFTTIAIYRVRDGLVTDIWKASDLLQMMEQLRVLPPRGSGPVRTISHMIAAFGRMGLSMMRNRRVIAAAEAAVDPYRR